MIRFQIIFVVILITASPVMANNNFYLSAKGGADFYDYYEYQITASSGTYNLKDKYDAGFFIGGSAGKYFADNYRVEAEVVYEKNKVSEMSSILEMIGGPTTIDSTPWDGKATIWAFMANGYYDFFNGKTVKPYIQAGLGFVHLAISELSTTRGSKTFAIPDTSYNGFSYKLGLGVGFDVTSNFILDVNYYYLVIPDIDLSEYSKNLKIGIHNVGVGVRYNF